MSSIFNQVKTLCQVIQTIDRQQMVLDHSFNYSLTLISYNFLSNVNNDNEYRNIYRYIHPASFHVNIFVPNSLNADFTDRNRKDTLYM